MNEVIETREEHTARYGTIVYSNVKDKGWTYQYDSVLVFGNENYDDVPRLLDEDAVESGELMPELDEMDNDAFYPTFEEAQNAMYGDMSNMYHMGCIAGFC